ncbi:hypothetical protein [Pseudochrobactrum saccharolyticum]|uniref:Uncharacterized protein n=1 Tax=Pseudochrobactrum saccharolyticum TaxID=354352 RepID=A0A7W8EN67_9HYPH|nr:hypothetical protein [Pseudochrobactrum saccharolyticum]KAB0540364.1 hypothetical protein F7P81_03025 [Pseudochrobactrum saccharolyticum]MBB5089894.1 hypothetical protein [Pseudochrobactrum saccharolyticum]MDP8251799.1 hypothetical protein [Pseudochrobactrum saccharolyticum]
MRYRNITLICGLATFLTVPAVAVSAQPLFEITAVNRDVVPAGVPAAFEVAFPKAARSEAKVTVGDDNFLFVPLAFIPLSDTRVALVSTGANECTSQACSGLNAVHYLDHDAGEPRYPYTSQGEWLNVGMTGVVGNPADSWGWSADIADAPVLYTEGGGGGQGLFCSFGVLTELGASGPVEIARIPVAFSDARDEATAKEITGMITAAEKGKSITVSYKSGSENFQEVYKRGADGRFTLEGQSRVPSC